MTDNSQIHHLPIHHLQPNPLQPRGEFQKEELEDLRQSILEHGIIEPLVVAHTPAGYQIIAGERRWRAAKLAGFEEVPVVIKKTTPRGMLEMALIENVQRVDLNSIERGKAFQRLMTEFKLSNTDLAKKVGKSPAYVSNSLRLLLLPDAIKDGLIGGLIAEGHARALAAIDNQRLMIEAYKIILKENGSVRRAEALSRMMNEQLRNNQSPTKKDLKPILNSELDIWKETLEQALGQHSNVRLSRSKRQTKVNITLNGTPEQTQEQLEKILQLAKLQ
ncbi:MAG: ParB/RepB/Spo0J family partition protein [Patescibacteria group bacterium]